MKYKSFNLTNFIGLKYFSPESIAELQDENDKYEQAKNSKPLKRTQTEVTIEHCAKCKKSCGKSPKNYVYSYNEKKKDYKKFFLCEKCLMKCKKCNKIGKTGIFVYIWDKSKNDYSKLFYCMDCYKKANLKQCSKCKKSVDSEVVTNSIIYCAICGHTNKEHKINSAKLKTVDISKLNANDQLSKYGYKPGQKVKIYNANNNDEFVEIIWPKNSTAGDVMDLIKGG